MWKIGVRSHPDRCSGIRSLSPHHKIEHSPRSLNDHHQALLQSWERMNFRAAAYDLYLVGVNFLLRFPSHRLRLLVVKHFGRAQLGKGNSIERHVRLLSKGGVIIGSQCMISRGAVLDGRGGLTIGDVVNVSSEALLLTADHDPDSADFSGRLRPVIIGSHCWIGARSIVLPGSTIGDGVVVAAGSVVHGCVPPWTIVAGSPATFLRSRATHAQASLSVEPYRRWFH